MEFIYVKVHKPYNMLCQFTQEQPGDLTLQNIPGLPKDIYPVGRLDKDSEGLLILTNDNHLKNKLSHPSKSVYKEYYVVVEGIPTKEQLESLTQGVIIKANNKKWKTLPAKIKEIHDLPEHLLNGGKPIRYRKNIPVSYLSISIKEGKNRQVRKMCASVNLPVLRLIRIAIGKYSLDNLIPGTWCSFVP